MQFLENRKLNAWRSGAIFGVHRNPVGFTEDANRAIAQEERLSFIENGVAKYCDLLEAAMDPVVKSFGADLTGWFDIDSLRYAIGRRNRIDSAAKAWAMGVHSTR